MESKIESTHPSRICIENGSNFSWFWELLKKRSRKDFPLDCSCIVHIWNWRNCTKTQSNVVLTLDRLSDSSAHAVTIHRQRHLWVSRAVIGAEVSYTTWGTPITRWEIFSKAKFWKKSFFRQKKFIFSIFSA